MRRRLVEIAPAAVAAGLLGGGALGLAPGRHYPGAGYPALLADAVTRGMLWGLLAGAAFALLYAAAAGWTGRRLPPRLAVPAAAALAALPLVAAGGYRLDLEVGLRPRELLEPRALEVNLTYLALCAGVWVLVALALMRREGRREAGDGRSSGRVATGAAAVGLASLALLQGGVALAFRPRAGEASRPNVVVLLIDALRADHLSSYGYHRPTTPAIDRLAADGVLFREAVAQSTFTKASIASLFTGRHPFQHGLYWGNLEDRPGRIVSDVLARSETTLAEVLRRGGYLTMAWVQNTHLRGFMGFDQGFVDYRDQQGGIRRIHRRLWRFLRGPAQRYPFFAYVHYIDLHDPYRPEPPYDTLFGAGGDPYAGIDLARWGAYLEAVRRGEVALSPREVARLEDLYDGQLRFIDDEIGRLLDLLEEEGLYDDCLILLTSDHGDAFYEHGFISHSATPYEELVRVPLIVKFPGGRHAGRRVEEPVRLIDAMPTLLEAAGLETPPEVSGCALQPLLDGPRGERGPGCAEAIVEIAEDGAAPTVAVRTGGFKYIHRPGGRDELYDLERDPREQVDLIAAGLPVAEDLRRRALEVVAARPREAGERIELDEETLRQLEALGYVD